MDDLHSKIKEAKAWFPHEQESPYVFISVSEKYSQAWADTLGTIIRRCYISDTLVKERALKKHLPEENVINSKLPDPGSTMSGDFGELLVNFYQASQELPHNAIGFNKWRLKQDRNKPAPHSDVVHLVLPHWPKPSSEDRILCSEVKTKSTNSSSKPLTEAIQDCNKDQTSRLAKTLIWLRDRTINDTEMDDVNLNQLDRFINAIDAPPVTRQFRAVLVICSSLVHSQLDKEAPTAKPDDYTVVVISVPNLKHTYEAVFAAARKAITTEASNKTVIQ